jgi:hypothetical protein
MDYKNNIIDIYNLNNFNQISYDKNYDNNQLKIIEIFGNNNMFEIYINKNKINFNKKNDKNDINYKNCKYIISFTYIIDDLLNTNRHYYNYIVYTDVNNAFELYNSSNEFFDDKIYDLYNNFSNGHNLYHWKIRCNNVDLFNKYYLVIKFFNYYTWTIYTDIFYNYNHRLYFYNELGHSAYEHIKYILFKCSQNLYEYIHSKLNNNLINISLYVNGKCSSIYLTSIINILPTYNNIINIILTPLKITNSEFMNTINLFNKNKCDKCDKHINNKKLPYYSRDIFLCRQHLLEKENLINNFFEQNVSYYVSIKDIIRNIIRDIKYDISHNDDLKFFENKIYYS